jgi:hypothetical protein
MLRSVRKKYLSYLLPVGQLASMAFEAFFFFSQSTSLIVIHPFSNSGVTRAILYKFGVGLLLAGYTPLHVGTSKMSMGGRGDEFASVESNFRFDSSETSSNIRLCRTELSEDVCETETEETILIRSGGSGCFRMLSRVQSSPAQEENTKVKNSANALGKFSSK